ncbi:MAG: hypothetical protein HY438_00585 [DPANN group archaeon]|nr:hypothetical protein [DPANN group archaeon]
MGRQPKIELTVDGFLTRYPDKFVEDYDCEEYGLIRNVTDLVSADGGLHLSCDFILVRSVEERFGLVHGYLRGSLRQPFVFCYGERNNPKTEMEIVAFQLQKPDEGVLKVGPASYNIQAKYQTPLAYEIMRGTHDELRLRILKMLFPGATEIELRQESPEQRKIGRLVSEMSATLKHRLNILEKQTGPISTLPVPDAGRYQ